MEWIELIKWVVGSGILGGAAGWFASRITRRMDLQQKLLKTIEDQAKSITELYEKQGNTDRILAARNNCRYIATCPIDIELWRAKAVVRKQQQANRQPGDPGTFADYPGDGTPDTGRPPP